MNIYEFVTSFRNHPILFVGTGISLRYLENSQSWDGLLKKISFDLFGNEERYLDIKSHNQIDYTFRYDKIATELEMVFNSHLEADRNGKFKHINDLFYRHMEKNNNISRFKLYIAELFKESSLKENMTDELAALKKARKSIGSIITTNYDTFIEKIFEFAPLIGNDIMLSNPYGSLYKIHGCINYPEKIIVTEQDYIDFNKKYELIRAQLLSLFIHNPIIFLGYSISDTNIKQILKTIFTYVAPNSEEAEKIKSNFLLVEYKANSTSMDVVEHDIDIEGHATIRINKIATNDYITIYDALSNLSLPVSAMDIRKVQSIANIITMGGEIQVKITEDLEDLKNKDTVIAIGSLKTVHYVHQNSSELIRKYFEILEESNKQMISIIDSIKIQTAQWFPIYGFSTISTSLTVTDKLKRQQQRKLDEFLIRISPRFDTPHTTISEILVDSHISVSFKGAAIIYSCLNNVLDMDDFYKYLKDYPNKSSTEFRRLLCAYDYRKYDI